MHFITTLCGIVGGILTGTQNRLTFTYLFKIFICFSFYYYSCWNNRFFHLSFREGTKGKNSDWKIFLNNTPNCEYNYSNNNINNIFCQEYI